MRHGITLFAVSALLISCQEAVQPVVPQIDTLTLLSAQKDALRYLGQGSDVVATCGGSAGVGYYLADEEPAFSEDAIADGVIVFAFRADGSPDILHRDALKEMVVSSESGATVTRIFDSRSNDNRLGIWIVSHAESGVVETYNLALDSMGKPVALWNSNKSAVLMRARTLSFVANCEFS